MGAGGIMGWHKHDALILMVASWYGDSSADEKMEAIRAKTREENQHFIIGPLPLINGYTCWIVTPDGSKEGWPPSDEMDMVRKEIVDAKLGSVVHVEWDNEYGDRGAQIMYTTDHPQPGWNPLSDNED